MTAPAEHFRKHVQVTMTAETLALLEELADQDTLIRGHARPRGRGDRSATVCELIHAEVARRTPEELVRMLRARTKSRTAGDPAT